MPDATEWLAIGILLLCVVVIILAAILSHREERFRQMSQRTDALTAGIATLVTAVQALIAAQANSAADNAALDKANADVAALTNAVNAVINPQNP